MENRVNKKSESEIENFLRENQDFLKDIVINHQDKLYQILETQLISKEAKKLKALLDADFEKATPGTQKYIKKIIHDNWWYHFVFERVCDNQLNFSGMTQECDMIGKTDFDCIPEGYSPIEWDKICKEFQEDEIRVLREGMIQKEEKTIANDGTVKWFRTTKKLVEVDGEQYIYGESVDISKEKEGVEKLNLLLKNNPFSMYFKDKKWDLLEVTRYMAKTVYEDRKVRKNKEAEMKELLEKRPFFKDVSDQLQEHHNNEEKCIDIIWDAIQTGRYTDKELFWDSTFNNTQLIEKKVMEDDEIFNDVEKLIQYYGSYKYIRTIKVPWKDNMGRIIGIFGISVDETEQARMREELEKKRKEIEKNLIEGKEKAEESDRLKSAFLANMSHEIRTPMNAIMGFSNLLVADLTSEGNLTPQKEEYMKYINSSWKTLLSLIDDIIDISKIQSGSLEIKKENVEISSAIEQVIKELELEAKKKNIIIHHDVLCELYVKGDDIRIKQILSNFIKNSIKYSRESWADYTSCKNIYITEDIDESSMKISVKDEGIGIPQEHLEKIFERFHQIGKSWRTEGGVWLGLAISKSLAELMQGKIEVESEWVGKGSTFSFIIPLSTE